MNTRTKTLPNHRQGVREVMLDKNGLVLPVISATRVSCTPDRITTYQRPEVDGFVVRCNKAKLSPNNVEYSVYRYLPHTDSMVPCSDDDADSSRIIANLDPILLEWLSS